MIIAKYMEIQGNLLQPGLVMYAKGYAHNLLICSDGLPFAGS